MTGKDSAHGRKIPVLVMAVFSLIVVCAWRVLQNSENDDPGNLSSAFPGQSEFTDLSTARRAAQRGDYEAALQEVDHIIESQPDSVPANLLKSELLFRLYRADEMRPVLGNILRQAPDHFEAHANLAFALRFSGELDEAEKHVDWCLSRRPDFLPVARIKAEIYRDRGDADRALLEVHHILKMHPNDVDTRILEAELMMYQREFEAAYQSLKPYSGSSQHNHRLMALMAQLCQLIGKDAEAAEYRDRLNDLKIAPPTH
ncbi:MAG: hypothetical protein R3C20_08035 [Planctomycetaceae bacterium]